MNDPPTPLVGFGLFTQSRQWVGFARVARPRLNHTRSDQLSAVGKTMVFATESIENIPAGWRARETYKILGPDEFVEVFELAEPGKNFEVYSDARYVRKKQ